MADTSGELIKKVSADMASAMKAQEKERLSALRYLKSMLLENSTAKKPLSELDVVISHAKKLEGSLEAYPQGHELRKKILQEISYLAPYLPQKMTEEEVMALISSIIQKGATNMGMVMKELASQIKGRFDGKRAGELVNQALLKKDYA